MEMYVKIVYLETIKRENGLSGDIKILMNVDIGIYIVSKNINSILGININDVLRNKKMSEIDYDFICVDGCGDTPLNKMKHCKDPEDPTLVCPRCGNCKWYIVPKKE